MTLKIPSRTLTAAEHPLIDVAYVDWVELRYRAGQPVIDSGAPLMLSASARPTWLAGPTGSASHRLCAVAGWEAVSSAAEVDEGSALRP